MESWLRKHIITSCRRCRLQIAQHLATEGSKYYTIRVLPTLYCCRRDFSSLSRTAWYRCDANFTQTVQILLRVFCAIVSLLRTQIKDFIHSCNYIKVLPFHLLKNWFQLLGYRLLPPVLSVAARCAPFLFFFFIYLFSVSLFTPPKLLWIRMQPASRAGQRLSVLSMKSFSQKAWHLSIWTLPEMNTWMSKQPVPKMFGVSSVSCTLGKVKVYSHEGE